MYSRKGIMEWYIPYVNPGKTFSAVYAAYVSNMNATTTFEGISVTAIKATFFLLDYFRLLLSCLSLCITENISVIRAYCGEMPGLIACITGKLLGIPVVVSVHGHIDIYMKERGFSFIARALVYIVHSFVYSLSDYIWCVGEGLADSVASHGISHRKITIIYNKVDTNRFANAKSWRHETRKKYGIKDEEVVLIHVGRLSSDKRIDRIINALPLLDERNIPFRFVIVGPDPGKRLKGVASLGQSRYEPTSENLRILVKKSGIENHVLFMGRLSREHLVRAIGMSDIYVSASTGEGFGIAIAEAQAASLPIIATRELMTRNHGLLVNPRTSLFYGADNTTELANAIMLLAQNKEIYERLSRGSVEESSKYAWSRIEQLEANCYRAVIGLLTKQSDFDL